MPPAFTPLPYDRDLTPDERRGFSMACAAMARMGQLLASQPSVGGPVSDVIRDTRERGTVMFATACAFERRFGMGALRRPSPDRAALKP
jgi:hypothetical protein